MIGPGGLRRCLAATVHLALVSLPAWALGPGRALGDPRLLALWALLTLYFLSESEAARARASEDEIAGRAGLLVLSGLGQLAVFWAAAVERLPSGPGLPAGALAGALCLLGGIGLRRAATRRLGERFLDQVRLLPVHELETRGPYALMRHPSEAGTLAITAGAALLASSPLAALVLAGVVVPTVVWRTRLEDRLLTDRFGPRFERYARRVSCFGL